MALGRKNQRVGYFFDVSPKQMFWEGGWLWGEFEKIKLGGKEMGQAAYFPAFTW